MEVPHIGFGTPLVWARWLLIVFSRRSRRLQHRLDVVGWVTFCLVDQNMKTSLGWGKKKTPQFILTVYCVKRLTFDSWQPFLFCGLTNNKEWERRGVEIFSQWRPSVCLHLPLFLVIPAARTLGLWNETANQLHLVPRHTIALQSTVTQDFI